MIRGTLIGAILALVSTDACALQVVVKPVWWRDNRGGRDIVLYVYGPSVEGDFAKVTKGWRNAKRLNPGKKLVGLEIGGHGGGDSLNAEWIGDWAAKNQISVILSGDCVSACSYIALSALGQGRLFVASSTARVGVHQAIYRETNETAWDYIAHSARQLNRYRAPREAIEAMRTTPTGDMTYLNARQLLLWGAHRRIPLTLSERFWTWLSGTWLELARWVNSQGWLA